MDSRQTKFCPLGSLLNVDRREILPSYCSAIFSVWESLLHRDKIGISFQIRTCSQNIGCCDVLHMNDVFAEIQ